MAPSTEERFLEKVSPEPNSGCWLWTGYVGKNGYAKFARGRQRDGMAYAHRIAYELYREPIPRGLQLDHLCRVRCCVNPQHLEIVTQQVNTQRGRNRNREKTHCPQGHALAGNNLRRYIDAAGRHHRQCRICYKISQRRYDARGRRN